MIERTFFAVSSDETRYNLNGVFFEPSGPTLRLVATDGHRLSLVEREVGAGFGLKRGVILPKKPARRGGSPRSENLPAPAAGRFCTLGR